MIRTKTRHNPKDRELRELNDDGELRRPESPEEVLIQTKDVTAPVVTEEDIRFRAYCLWNAAGWPAGDGVEFWLQAERELHQP